MALQDAPTETDAFAANGKKFFTVDQADASLVYLRRVVSDIRLAYGIVVDLRRQIEDPANDHRVHALEAEYEDAMDRLTELVDELSRVGVELKDFERGQVDFPALLDGREVYLCWQSGEDAVTSWHEIDEGYAGRHDLSTFVSGQAA